MPLPTGPLPRRRAPFEFFASQVSDVELLELACVVAHRHVPSALRYYSRALVGREPGVLHMHRSLFLSKIEICVG